IAISSSALPCQISASKEASIEVAASTSGTHDESDQGNNTKRGKSRAISGHKTLAIKPPCRILARAAAEGRQAEISHAPPRRNAACQAACQRKLTTSCGKAFMWQNSRPLPLRESSSGQQYPPG